METVYFSEMMVSTYKSSRRYNPKPNTYTFTTVLISCIHSFINSHIHALTHGTYIHMHMEVL
jgi:hypothetical protein